MTRAYTYHILLALGIALVVLMAAPPLRAADTLDAVQRALRLAESGTFDAARTTLTSLPTTATPDSLVLAAQGTIELYDGKLPAADSAFRAALAQEPANLPALWGLSLCLLQRQRVFEAAALIDRAAQAAPANAHVKALQSYVYCLLGRISDAGQAGKAALDGGDKSPFLLATLAQVQRRMGYAQKALEFGSFAARAFASMDYLAPQKPVFLPLTMTIIDNPASLLGGIKEAAPAKPAAVRTDLELELPKASQAAHVKPLEIATPKAGSTLRGVQPVQVIYRDGKEVKFLVFLVDGVLRGMITDLPYHFTWDADAASAGTHILSVRAYDARGMLIQEDSIAVTSVAGQQPAAPRADTSGEVQQQMLAMTMPLPAPLSLFMQLGYWHKDVGETAQALATFEKAAAIDPTTEGVLDILAQLYRETGLHPISPTGDAYRGPADGKKRVALTFDDGPNPLYTPTIMDELKRYEGHATFFMVGKMLRQYPELALQLLAEGHELGNHTYTHPNLTKLTRAEIIAEVLRTRVALKDITSRACYLFRPPGGQIDTFVIKQLKSLDNNIIYWDVNAGEYRKLSPEAQTAAMLTKIREGSIVLMHNGPVDGTMSILPALLDGLHAKGFTFVTVSELLSGK